MSPKELPEYMLMGDDSYSINTDNMFGKSSEDKNLFLPNNLHEDQLGDISLSLNNSEDLI
jgi:hypothetical protein